MTDMKSVGTNVNKSTFFKANQKRIFIEAFTIFLMMTYILVYFGVLEICNNRPVSENIAQKEVVCTR